MWQKQTADGLAFYTLPHWAAAGAAVFYSCSQPFPKERAGPFAGNLALHVGDHPQAVIERRKQFLAAIHGDPRAFVSCCQTHSRNICAVSTADGGSGFDDLDSALPDTDGLVTDAIGLTLATFYADCLPLVCFDPHRYALGMAHAGWKGTLQNIASALVETMTARFGSRPDELWLAIGGHIRFCCYEVGPEFREQFLAVYDQGAEWFRPGAGDRFFFDNQRANTAQLVAAGVRPDKIDALTECTCCGQDFFSYRRSRGGPCGRQGLFAYLV